MINKEEILKNLTLKEKIALTEGKDFWHTKEVKDLNAIKMSDGPHGLRCQPDKTDMLGINVSLPSTCFPSASLTACSFDISLIEEMAKALALEAKDQGVSVVLGPGTNIKRDPLCGRNFEYFSEDPYLAGKMSSSFINALQSEGISASLKHFALNNQEYKRLNSNSLADERTMREIYLKPFEIAVKESKPDTVMCSYNLINGIHSSDNKRLLTDILRNEWGYQGLVVTDWGAMNDRVESLKAGCDLNMPGGSDYMAKEVEKAILNNELDERDLDSSVLRVLDLIIKHQYDLSIECDYLKNHELAVKIASESMVLLKNDNHILPLNKHDDICLIGLMAEEPRYQGAGSSHINPTKITSLLSELKDIPYAKGYLKNGDTTDKLIKEAIELASLKDKVIINIGLPDNYESEGFDRTNLKLPEGHLRLVEEILKVNSNVIILLSSGSVVELPFKDQVKAILYTGLAGQGVGRAIYNILFGLTNPSGKLAESWPIKYEDAVTSSYYSNNKHPKYYEGIYVGYRYYNSFNKEVAYPFGHGLSYSSFKYSDLNINGCLITASITNESDTDGSEVVELYVANPKNHLYRPSIELKGFKKVFIKAKETVEVSFKIDDSFFEIYDDGFKKIDGTYEIILGASSSDLRLKKEIKVEGYKYPSYEELNNTFYFLSHDVPDDSDFIKLYGSDVSFKEKRKGEYTMDSTMLEMSKDSKLMKFLSLIIEKFLRHHLKLNKNEDSPELKMMLSGSIDSPLRNLNINVRVKGGIFKGLLAMANGHILKGLVKMIFNN